MKSQKDQILAHLKKGKTITPLEALKLFGCFRLAARIHDLRMDGHDIEVELIDVNDAKVASYWYAA